MMKVEYFFYGLVYLHTPFYVYNSLEKYKDLANEV